MGKDSNGSAWRQVEQRWFIVPWGPEMQAGYPNLHAWRKPAKWGRGTGKVVVYRQPRDVCYVAALDVGNTALLQVHSSALVTGLQVLDKAVLHGELTDWFPLPDIPRPGPEPASVDVVVLRDPLPYNEGGGRE